MKFLKLLAGALLLLPLSSLSARAQVPPTPTGDVFVDARGVLRWQKSKQEVALFGVNYTAPFAYSYRALSQAGTPPQEAIDQDVYHLSRLGVDAFRLHVWDIEITDTAGNLQQNEHLRLLDYLITKLKERNIKIILTPIAYWGNAYPEPKNTGTGFSSIYDKGQAYTNYFHTLAERKSVTVPLIDSARILFSVGPTPMYVQVNKDVNGELAYAGANIENSDDPNLDVIFDFVEMAIPPNAGIYINTTRVDHFG
ncbi:MAG: hypothetical protein EOO58_04110, partial [Hymenobacter sp.]